MSSWTPAATAGPAAATPPFHLGSQPRRSWNGYPAASRPRGNVAAVCRCGDSRSEWPPEVTFPLRTTSFTVSGRNLDGSAALICLMFISFGVQCCSLKRVIIGIIGCFPHACFIMRFWPEMKSRRAHSESSYGWPHLPSVADPLPGTPGGLSFPPGVFLCLTVS